MYKIDYTDTHGMYWDFSKKLWNVAVAEAGIDGLVGTFTDATVKSSRWGGQLLVHQAVEPMKGSLTFVINAKHGKDVDDIYARLRAAFHPSLYGELNISGDRYGSLSTLVRLDGAIAPPEVDTDKEKYVAKFKVPLISDKGMWYQEPFVQQGVVLVSNSSPVPIHPSVTWSGEGRTLMLPSGWTVKLPATQSQATVSLDPTSGYAVTRNGEVVPELTRELVKTVVPEPTPAGSTREYRCSDGVTLIWQIPTLDPWL